MKNLFIFIFLSTNILVGYSQSASLETTKDTEVTTYYFIRHAEKVRVDPNNKDPELNTLGHERAFKWRQVLKSIDFDAIYTTDYNRTKQTAQPIANSNKLKMHIYDPKTMDLDLFLIHTKGKNVLVVGHSNTTPEFVNKLLKEKTYKNIDDRNNSNLYIVSITDGVVSSNLLHIN